ncbi:MAG: UDP-N-acetylglucosamine 2-epimerase (non-hydrolyzing) [Saprospiraceae bacterium]|nr:UDP-N-acetylglucosamine 2-epimerase (non-hydrolyzing) [Saprospiraceae bacterium]
MVLVALGTRPEVVKLYPVINELKKEKIPFKILFTGQHQSLFLDVCNLIPNPDYHLQLMKKNTGLNSLVSAIIRETDPILEKLRPQLVIVQGDTSTVLGVGLAAFYKQIPVGHVEAGLRTFDRTKPFPEETNRCLVSQISTLNWAPTQQAKENLENEGAENIYLTGNTIVDATLGFNFKIKNKNKVLITLHRRENFGERLKSLFTQLEELAREQPQLEFIFPMHPNPSVMMHRSILKKVKVIAPLPYAEMLQLLSEVRVVISDSGGIQEECATYRKPILVCRDSTERPEGVEAGFARLVGTDIRSNFDWAMNYSLPNLINPYGDGKASIRIVHSIKTYLNV